MHTKEELYKKYKENPKDLETYLELLGYKKLGWQVHSGNCDALKVCFEIGHMGHKGQEKVRVFDIQHTQSGSNCTYWCDECKNYWKLDMSD